MSVKLADDRVKHALALDEFEHDLNCGAGFENGGSASNLALALLRLLYLITAPDSNCSWMKRGGHDNASSRNFPKLSTHISTLGTHPKVYSFLSSWTTLASRGFTGPMIRSSRYILI
jgi:hypothetical protein